MHRPLHEKAPLIKIAGGILFVLFLVLAAWKSQRQDRRIDPEAYGKGAKLINVGLCKRGSMVKELESVELVKRDKSGAVTVLASASADRHGTYTAKLPDALAPGWYALRVNGLEDIDDGHSADLMPVYVDVSDFTVLYVRMQRSIRKAVESYDEPASCNIHDTGINDWFIESHAGMNNVKKFSDGTDAEPLSHAFFAFRQSDATLYIGRMLDFEIVQTLPRPSEYCTPPAYNGTSRSVWIMEDGERGGHQLFEPKELEKCYECHKDGDVRPGRFPSDGLPNNCHRCHAGAVGYTDGLYDPAQ